jgi:hypothetical protein
LHVLHQGAQNHKSTGLPARVVSSMSPPPTSGAENFNASGTFAGVSVGSAVCDGVGTALDSGVCDGATVDAAVVTSGDATSELLSPHAASNVAAMRGKTTRFTHENVPDIICEPNAAGRWFRDRSDSGWCRAWVDRAPGHSESTHRGTVSLIGR